MKKAQIYLHVLIACALSCTHFHNNQLYITAAPNEVVDIPLDKIFKTQKYQNLSFNSNVEYLSIINPISLTEKVRISGLGDQKLISYKFQKSTSSFVPLNEVSLLLYSGTSYYVQKHSQPFNTIPQFDSIIGQLEKKGQEYGCFDIVTFEKYSVADCTTDGLDYFSIASLGGVRQFSVPSTSTSNRKLDSIDNYIFRSSIDKLELFLFDQNYILLKTYLDSEKLGKLLGKKGFVLEIIDFQVYTNEYLSILNSSGELIILQLKSFNFILIEYYDTTGRNLIGYDYDVYTKSYVFIQQSLLTYVNERNEIFKVNVNSSAYDKVQLTKQYIIYSNLDQVTLFNQNLSLIDTTKLNLYGFQLYTKINQDGFFYVDDESFYYYSLQEKYYLHFQKQMQEQMYQEITLKQSIAPPCKIKIFSKVVPLNTYQIYQQQDEAAILDASYLPLDQQNFHFNPIFLGPNIEYNFYSPQIKIETNKIKIVEFQNLQNQANVIFRKTLFVSENVFYLIHQNDNFEIFGYCCLITKNQEPSVKIHCENVLKFTIGQRLYDEISSIWWFNNGTLYFAYVIDEAFQAIQVYYLNQRDQSFERLAYIPVVGYIFQLQTDGFNFYVLTQTSTKVYYINWVFGYWKSLDPAELIVASQMKPHHLFQKTKTQIKLYQLLEEKLTLIWQLDTVQEAQIKIFKDYFIVFSYDSKDSSAKIYSFKDFQNIYFLKELSFYQYKCLEFASITSDSNKNFLYIKAMNALDDNIILVYNLEQPSIGALFTTIQASATQMTASNNILLLTGANNLQQNYQIQENFHIQSKLQPLYSQPQYTNQIQVQVTVSNDQIQKTLQPQNLTIVNRGKEIFLTKQNLELTYQEEAEQLHCVDIGQNWYYGQSLEISLRRDSLDIEIKKSITKLDGQLQFSHFISEFDEQTLIQLHNNTIILVIKENLTTYESELNQYYEYTNLLLVIDSLVFVEAKWKESNQYEIIAIKCENFKCSIIPEFSLVFNARIKRVFIDKNFFFTLVGNQIIVYETQGDFAQIYEFQEIRKIYPFSAQEISFIELNPLKDNIYAFMVADIYGHFEFITYEISKTSHQNYFISINLSEIIQYENQFYPDGQAVSGLFYEKENNQLIITFTHSASYAFEVTFDCSINYLCDLSQFNLVGIFQQYGDAIQPSQYISTYLNQNILSVVYVVNDHYEVLLFDTHQSMRQNTQSYDIKFTIGALKSPLTFGQNYKVQSFVYYHNNSLYLLSSVEDKYKLAQYSLLRSPQFCMKSSKFEKKVELSLSNTYTKMDTTLSLKIAGPQDEDTTGNQPLLLIIIIFIVIIVVGILVVALQKCAKLNKKVTDNQKFILQQ